MMRMLQRICIVAVASTVPLGQLSARAAITSITVDNVTVPNEPLTVGHLARYTANMNGANGMPGPTTWEYRAQGGAQAGPWVNAGQGQSITIVESRVGSFNVRATTSFQDGTVSVMGVGVTISGPDRDVITAGLNVVSQNMVVQVSSEVRNGAVPIGPNYVDGYPQERIRRPQWNPPFVSDWSSPDQDFYLTGNRAIIDNKAVSTQYPAFANCAIGQPFDDFYQQNRMLIKDGYGVLQPFYFQERHYQKIKVSATSWKLVLAP